MLRERKKVLIPMLCMVVMCFAALVTSSYAWLGVSRIPFISDLSISAISETVGFSSEGNLFRQFRARYGMTPRQYRSGK